MMSEFQLDFYHVIKLFFIHMVMLPLSVYSNLENNYHSIQNNMHRKFPNLDQSRVLWLTLKLLELRNLQYMFLDNVPMKLDFDWPFWNLVSRKNYTKMNLS